MISNTNPCHLDGTLGRKLVEHVEKVYGDLNTIAPHPHCISEKKITFHLLCTFFDFEKYDPGQKGHFAENAAFSLGMYIKQLQNPHSLPNRPFSKFFPIPALAT